MSLTNGRKLRRVFDFYDEAVITKELSELPARIATILIVLMEHYQTIGRGDVSPAIVEDCAFGIKSLRREHFNRLTRMLFYIEPSSEVSEKLWILTFYKTELGKVPEHILERAKNRKLGHIMKQTEDDNKLRQYADDRSARDPDFKALYDAEVAVMELIRGRKARGLSQVEMAKRLHVSESYLVQVEGLTKKLSADVLFRYAAELGLSLKVCDSENTS